jgi:hypothetical protein
MKRACDVGKGGISTKAGVWKGDPYPSPGRLCSAASTAIPAAGMQVRNSCAQTTLITTEVAWAPWSNDPACNA